MPGADQNNDFLNFDVRIAQSSEGQYKVEAFFKEASVASEIAAVDENRVLSKWISDLELTRSSHAETRRSDPFRGRSKVADVREPDLKAVGTGLFDTLMCVTRTDDGQRLQSKVLQFYRNCVSVADDQNKRLRIRLHIPDPELATLPWEYLYDDQDQRGYLALARTSLFSRFPDESNLFEPVKARPPLRILGMISHPENVAKLDVEGERTIIEEAIKMAGGQIELHWLETVEGSESGQTAADLLSAMDPAHGPWHVFHFVGHGGFDTDSGQGYLVLSDEEGKEPIRLYADRLGRYLSGQRDHLRLVVLNSCEGARASEKAKYSSVASYLVREGVPAVISMQHEITDRAAKEFSRALYREVAKGLGPEHLLRIDHAMSNVRNRMELSTSEWATPVLYTSSEDGSLLSQDWRAILSPVALASETPGASVASLSKVAEPKPSDKISSPVLDSSRAEQVLRLLGERVEQWVQDERDKSHLAATLAELGLESASAFVDSPIESVELSTDQRMSEILEEAGGQLLILGEAGTGKTRWMLLLVQQLLDAWNEDKSQSLPVPLKISRWRGNQDEFVDFLAAAVYNQYKISRRHARPLIEEGRLTLALDGLDEVSPLEHRISCVEAINQLAVRKAGWSLVTTCRFKEYAEMSPKHLNLGGAIRLQELTRDRILEALERAGSDLSGVRAMVSDDSTWEVLASTPVLLAMLVRAYEGVREEDARDNELDSIDHRLKELMDRFMENQWRTAS